MLPPIDITLLPADVRQAGPEAEKLYAAALQFEGMLVQQISTQMFAAAQSDQEGGSGPYGAMLPQALADGITAGGGLGLAPELYRSFRQRLGLPEAA